MMAGVSQHHAEVIPVRKKKCRYTSEAGSYKITYFIDIAFVLLLVWAFIHWLLIV